MVKDTIKEIEKTYKTINPYYDMTVPNINDILNNGNTVVDMICLAFRFGYIQGTKAEKVRIKKANEVNRNTLKAVVV